MKKSKIEWCDYTINPIKGYCPNDCPYCYAHRMYNRFGWDRKLRFDESVFKGLKTIKEPSRIFVGSMIDMYYPAVISWSPFAMHRIIIASEMFPQHTFITLTKFPEDLYKYDFPKNWWVGITIDGTEGRVNKMYMLDNLRMDTNIQGIRFISFEPLLKPVYDLEDLDGLDWIITGGKFPGPVHKKEWIDDIVKRADDLGIPVFIKDNANYPIVRKEFPV